MNEFLLQVSTALAAGAVVSLKDVGSDAVKSAYHALKNMVFGKHHGPSDDAVKAVPDSELREFFAGKVAEKLEAIDDAELKKILDHLANELASDAAVKTETVGIHAVGWVQELKLGEVRIKQSRQPGDHKKTIAKLEEGAGSINIDKLDM